MLQGSVRVLREPPLASSIPSHPGYVYRRHICTHTWHERQSSTFRSSFHYAQSNKQGKLLWKGKEGLLEALELVSAAEAAHTEASDARPTQARAFAPSPDPNIPSTSTASQSYQVAYRSGIVRPARSEKQCNDFGKALNRKTALLKASAAPARPQANKLNDEEAERWAAGVYEVLGTDELAQLIPGFDKSSIPESKSAAFHIPSALVLHPPTYLESLWRACVTLSSRSGSKVRLEKRTIHSLGRDLVNVENGADAVVVCTGAATGALEELRVSTVSLLCFLSEEKT